MNERQREAIAALIPETVRNTTMNADRAVIDAGVEALEQLLEDAENTTCNACGHEDGLMAFYLCRMCAND